ncbi:MAG TPA: ABC transporter permease subunit [Burkholderiaceae bacterium]
MIPARHPPKPALSRQRVRSLLWQAALAVLLAALLWQLWHNVQANLDARQIRSGFGFLFEQAGFDVSEGPVAYTAQDTYLLAFAAGVANTLRVALAAIVTATLIGIVVGVGRLARNPLVRGVCTAYVEAIRNTPLIIQLFGWYVAISELLPDTADAMHLAPHVTLSKSGLQLPSPVWTVGWTLGLAGLALGIALLFFLRRRALARRLATAHMPAWAPLAWAMPFVCALAGWLLGGAPTAWDFPEAGTFAITGGMALSPEFLALYLGLSIYTASYIAEIVRAGITAVARGQREASHALGLSRLQQLRLVVFPQALRLIVPPLSSQYLNLTKNSSLAVAVGYPDLVSIANTSLNQNGQALECLAIIMLVYLCTSLATASFMHWFDRRVALVER